MQTSQNVHKTEIFVSHINSYQRVTTEKEDFNNNVDAKIVLGIPVHPFPQPLPPLHNGLMKKLAMVAGIKITYGLRNINSHSSRTAWLWLQLFAQYAKSRDQHRVLNVAPLPRGITQGEIYRSNQNIKFS